jgi:mannitol/fructose-specific phosphotransferase system IIA component (Ntr-type)
MRETNQTQLLPREFVPRRPSDFINMRSDDIFSELQIVTELRATNQWEAIDELIDALVERGKIPGEHRKAIGDAVRKRERSMSTGIGYGIGMPHASTYFVPEVIAALGRSKAGINFDALDGRPVKLVILFLVPQGQFQKHLHTVAEMAKLLQKPALCHALLQAPDNASMLHIIRSPGIQSFLQENDGKGHYQIKLPPGGIRR